MKRSWNFPDLEIVDLDREVDPQGGSDSGSISSPPPDALQVSASLFHGV
jgi:hypothetical protein